MDRRLTAAIAIVATLLWIISFLADLFNPRYDPPTSIQAVMMLVAGAAFGSAVLQKGPSKNG